MKTVQTEVIIPEQRAIKTQYVAEDGRTFDFEEQCIDYEKRLAIQGNPVYRSGIPNVQDFKTGAYYNMYYIRSQEDYDFLMDMESFHPGVCEADQFSTFGAGWYMHRWTTGRGTHGVNYIVNLDNYIAQMDKEWTNWKLNVMGQAKVKEEELRNAERGDSES